MVMGAIYEFRFEQEIACGMHKRVMETIGTSVAVRISRLLRSGSYMGHPTLKLPAAMPLPWRYLDVTRT
jgi:hypothetical protein